MVNAVFRYYWFVGLCQSYMSIVLFDSELDVSTALSNINPAVFTGDAVNTGVRNPSASLTGGR